MNINSLVARSLILPVALVALGSAASAQDQATMGGPEAEAAAAQQAGNASEAEAGNPQVVAFVDYQFPNADTDGDGTLAAAEFTTWIGGLKAAEMEKAGQTVDQAAVKTYADNALLAADKDKNKVLSKTELVKFFGG